MRSVKVRDAKAEFSSLVEAAERGEPTTITKHGRPAAVIVPVEEARKLYPERRRDFVEFLLSYPGGVELERDEASSLREFEF
jgi:prevent-host-death family protein